MAGFDLEVQKHEKEIKVFCGFCPDELCEVAWLCPSGQTAKQPFKLVKSIVWSSAFWAQARLKLNK